jgi:hypothetical protein
MIFVNGVPEMKRLAMIFALILLAGTTHATFELTDPAEQILEEQQEPGYGESELPPQEILICEIDANSGVCFCVHEETGEDIEIMDEVCRTRVAMFAKPRES